MGVDPLNIWAVTDPVMRVVITKTRSSSAVERELRVLLLAIAMLLDAGLDRGKAVHKKCIF